MKTAEHRWALLQAAAADQRLLASHLRVLIRLCRELTTRRSQAIKVLWLGRQLGLDKGTVSRAVHQLASLGYIEQDRVGSGRVIHRLSLAARVPEVPATFAGPGAA